MQFLEGCWDDGLVSAQLFLPQVPLPGAARFMGTSSGEEAERVGLGIGSLTVLEPHLGHSISSLGPALGEARVQRNDAGGRDRRGPF